MKFLIACECSGAVRGRLRALGHDAWSCDLKAAEDGSEHHIQGDVFGAYHHLNPDAMIAFPDCTYLTNSAAWAFGDGPYHQKVRPETLVGAERRQARQEAWDFVRRLQDLPCVFKAFENPVGALSALWRKPDQIIHPFMFGDDASKGTCIWVEGFSPLVVPSENEWAKPRIVNGRPRWGNQTDSGQNRLSPGENRATDRSRTYPGIAEAMAMQWGGYVF